MRNVILVLGMHRSGTSAAAGLLVKLGGAQPKTPMPAAGGNERGYFESQALMTFHDELLASAGSSWTDWRQFNPAWYQSPAFAAFQKRAKQLFKDEYEGEPLAVFKDPRVCRFAPFWLEVLAGIKAPARVVIPVRAPLEVAFSMRKRDGFPLATGAVLWLRHILDAEIASRGLPRFIFTWDQLLRDWRSVAERASTELDLHWPRLSDATAHEIENFIGYDMVHHRVSAKELAAHPDIHEWTMSAYRAMLKLAREPRSGSALKTLDKTREAFNRASRMFGRMVLEEEIRSQALRCETAKLADERDHWSRQHDTATAELAAALQANERISLELNARDREASDLARAVAEQGGQREQAELALAREKSLNVQLANDLEDRTAEQGRQREQAELALARERSLNMRLASDLEDRTAEQGWQREQAELALARERSLNVQLANEQITNELRDRTAELALAHAELEKSRARQVESNAPQPESEEHPTIALVAHASVWKRLRLTIRKAALKWGWEKAPPLFDRSYYLEVYPDVRKSGIDPYLHYVLHGISEKRNPNRYFNTGGYLERNPDANGADADPLGHNLREHPKQGLDPGPDFLTRRYLDRRPDLEKSGMSRLQHFFKFRQFEGHIAAKKTGLKNTASKPSSRLPPDPR
ncbi:MAG: hypothetical protein ACRECP_06110 [Methylocella sp.]